MKIITVLGARPQFIKNNSSFVSEKFNLNFYGNGEASKKIVRELKNL